MRPKTREQGYLTFAQGEQYLQCAYLLALSVKTYCKINNFAVVVDKETPVPEHMQAVFDEVITIDTMAPFSNECLAWELTPFKETFKVESDMLVTSNIDHWWAGARIKNVCFTISVDISKCHITFVSCIYSKFNINISVCVYRKVSCWTNTVCDY